MTKILNWNRYALKKKIEDSAVEYGPNSFKTRVLKRVFELYCSGDILVSWDRGKIFVSYRSKK